MQALLLKHPVCTNRPVGWDKSRRAGTPAHRFCGPRPALTLIELLLTLAILGILAVVVIPQLSGDLPERLNAAAQVISADLDYARSLAVANNTKYLLTFDTADSEYALRHSGTNPLFNTLPRSPFGQTDDSVNEQTTKLAELPIPEPRPRLIAVVQMQGAGQSTSTLEFNSLGGTTSTQQTALWLVCGTGSLRRYISLTVDPITGLVTISQPVKALPSAIVNIVQQDLNQGGAQAEGQAPAGS